MQLVWNCRSIQIYISMANFNRIKGPFIQEIVGVYAKIKILCTCILIRFHASHYIYKFKMALMAGR